MQENNEIIIYDNKESYISNNSKLSLSIEQQNFGFTKF